MKIHIVFIFTFFSSTLTVFGQDSSEDFNYFSIPDTFKVHKAKDIEILSRLDSVKGKIFDSITSPKAYFFKNDYSMRIALKRKNSYIIFNPFEYNTNYNTTNNFIFERQDLNGKGNEELIIKWEFYAGHSGWENSIHEREGGLLIWDLDNLTQLMDFTNFHSFQNWWSEYVPDETDTLDYSEREVIRSDSHYECESYEVIIDKNIVTIKQNNNCPDQGEMNKYPITDKTVYEYRLTNKGLIRKK